VAQPFAFFAKGGAVQPSQQRCGTPSYPGFMPWGLKRYQQNRQLHFITFSCYHRAPLLGTEQARHTFARALERVRVWYGFYVVGYVVMPEACASADVTGGDGAVEIESQWTARERLGFYSTDGRTGSG
jgi:hypothetical protein